MAHTISESGASFPSTLTTPDNADDADAAFLEILLKALADRTQWLKALCTVGGVPRIAYVADVAGLQAVDVSGVGSNDVRLVKGVGLYQYDSGSSATEALPWIVQPSAGAGRWIHLLADYAPTNRVVSLEAVYDALGYSNATTGYVTVVSLNLPNAKAGDIVMIDWEAAFTSVGSGGSYSRITVTDGSDYDLAPTRHLHSAARESHGGHYKYTVLNDGTVSVKIKAASVSSGTTATDAGSTVTAIPSLRATLFRP